MLRGSHRLRFVLAGLAMIIAGVPRLQAATVVTASWLNPVSGNWLDRANWSTGFAPQSVSVAAQISAVGSPYTITIDSPQLTSALAGAVTIDSPDATLSIVGENVLTLRGPLTVSNGGVLDRKSVV